MSERYPDGQIVDHDAEGNVRLRFDYDGDETVSVVLDQVRLLSLISQLHERIEHSRLTSISPDQLRPGTPLEVRGFYARKRDDGSAWITLTAVVEGRTVTIPFAMSPADLAAFRDEVFPEAG